MKHIYLLTTLLVSLFFRNTHAQDLLKFRNGEELNVKVQEITPQEIKYKRFDNLSGPLITILKSTATSIRYENGVIEKLAEEVPPVVPAAYVESTTPVRDLSNANGFQVGDIVSADYYGVIYKGKVVEVNRPKLKAIVDLNKNGDTRRVSRKFSELTLVDKVALTTGYAKAGSYDDALLGQSDARKYYGGYQGAGTGTFLTAMLFGPVIGLIPAAACSSTPSDQARLTFPNPKLAQNMSYYTGYTEEAHRIKSKKVWGNFAFGSVVSILAGIAIYSAYVK